MRSAIFLWCLLCCFFAQAQSTDLYNDQKVSSVRIQISASNLQEVYLTGGSDLYFPATFVFDDGQLKDTVNNIGLRLRGNTSLASAKKSFKVSFNEYVAGQKYQGVKKLNLNGNHNDPTMAREKIYYDIWNEFGLPKRRTSFVRLFINDEYMGLYTNLEQLDKEWLEQNYTNENGNLYKCTYPAPLTYLGSDPQAYKDVASSTASGGRAYGLETNELEDDYTGLVDLITALNEPVDENFTTKIEAILDVQQCLKALAVEVICGHWDNYIYNKNNYYLYHDSTSGKFNFISYDADNTMGVDWVGIDWTTRDVYNWTESENRPLYSKLLEVPLYKNWYSIYLDSLAQYIVKPEILFPHIDEVTSLIELAAEEDVYRTYDYGYSMVDFYDGFTSTVEIGNHTPYGIKPFFENRIANLNITSTKAILPSLGHLHVWPNPSNPSDPIFIEATPYFGNEALYIITNTLGETVQTGYWTNGKPIALNALQNGLFYIEFVNVNGALQTMIQKVD